LVAVGQEIRCLARDPRRLGQQRVQVQIALGDLASPASFRHALRGIETVIHLAAAIRDQPRASIEELNAVATLRLVQAAERAGVRRFVFFSAIGASLHSRTRFFRSKALAERAVAASPLPTTIFAPSIVYDPGDRWVRLMRRLALLPVLPISGAGRAAYQPIWAGDVAHCVMAALERKDESARYELAGPEVLTYDQIARTVAETAGRHRPVVHVPLGLVRLSLVWLRMLFGDAVFATWEEAELLEVPMTTPRGTADAEALGVEPRRVADVLGGG
jgi:NADH dehydrogenase